MHAARPLPLLFQKLTLRSKNRRVPLNYSRPFVRRGDFPRGRSETPAMVSRQLRACSVLVLLAATLAGPARAQSAGEFVSLFNGKDLTGWKVPEGDGGHWKVKDGVIDYDAGSESRGDKNLWSNREYGDFILRLDWRLKEAPFVNKSIPYILPDRTHARDVHGKEFRLPLPDADSGVFRR